MIDSKSLTIGRQIEAITGGKMMHQNSACRQHRASMRFAVAELSRNWGALAILAAFILGPTGVLASEDDGFSPHLFVIVDESGSMKGRQSWIAEAIPALQKALDERNVNTLPDQIDFTLAGFTTHPRELAQRASDTEAAQAVNALRTNGGTEDGYVAIRNVLSEYLASVDYAPTTVILITDEDRDVTDRDLTLNGLADQLVLNGIVVHTVIRARVKCPDRTKGIGVDQNRVAVTVEKGSLSTCSDARTLTIDEYAELAWATGGLVWSLDALVFGPEQARLDALVQFVDALSHHVIAQWPTGILWTNIEYWPKNPSSGSTVTFDGSSSVSNKPDRQIIRWSWDFDGDGTVDQDGPIVANVFSAPGRYRVTLEIEDDSNPSSTGRKVLLLQVSE